MPHGSTEMAQRAYTMPSPFIRAAYTILVGGCIFVSIVKTTYTKQCSRLKHLENNKTSEISSQMWYIMEKILQRKVSIHKVCTYQPLMLQYHWLFLAYLSILMGPTATGIPCGTWSSCTTASVSLSVDLRLNVDKRGRPGKRSNAIDAFLRRCSTSVTW